MLYHSSILMLKKKILNTAGIQNCALTKRFDTSFFFVIFHCKLINKKASFSTLPQKPDFTGIK